VSRHITRVALSVSAVVAVTLPAFFVPACLSSSSTASDAGSSSSSSSSGGGTGSGSSSSSGGGTSDTGTPTGAGCLPPDAGTVATACLIDDMSSPITETGGYWYTFSDRTLPNSTILVPNPAGIISPLEGAQFPPATGDTAPGGPTVPGVGLVGFREFTGSGLTLWGAGMGFDWIDLSPPGDAGPDAAAALGVPSSFDGSSHTGISFYGISNTGKSQAVGIHFSDQREAAAAGLCNADAGYTVYDGGADTINNPSECSDDFVKSVNFTATWTNFTVKFSSTIQGFSDGTPLAALDPKTFQVNNPGYAGKGPIAAEPAWDISVAYITWYDGL
jgi:hypothetical protein